MSSPILQLDNVHVAYMQREILRGVTLRVHPGEIVALFGENGSGKSTTLKVVAGLLHPTQGAIWYRGRNLSGLGVSQRQGLGVGYLMQGGRVFQNLTVQENFDLSLAKMRTGVGQPARLGDQFPILRQRHGDRAGLLSGGQRQMLAVELLLAQRPDLLLLDEPTTALALDISLQMLENIAAYTRDFSAAALLVEHIPVASTFTTRHLRINEGIIH